MPVVPASPTYVVSTSGKKLIARAFRLIGVKGEELKAESLGDAKEALNHMLDAWNAERLTIYSLTQVTKALNSGTRSLTIGPGGDFDTVRPPKLEKGQAWIKDGDLEYELDVLTQPEYAAITPKTTSGLPAAIYYDAAFPLATAYLDPAPANAMTLILYSWGLLAQVSGLDEAISLPPAYAKAICYNLALELAPEYGKSSPNEVVINANDAKATLKRINIRPQEAELDSGLGDGDVYDRNAITRGFF